MDKRIIIRYEDNNSSRYDGKQFYELSSRVRRINGLEDSNFRIGEAVTVKTKLRIWKAVVVDCDPSEPPKKRRKSGRTTESFEIPNQGTSTPQPHFVVALFSPSRDKPSSNLSVDNHKTEGNKSSENSLKDSASNVLETAQQPETNLVAVVSLPLDTETNSQAPSPVNAETNPQAPSPVNAASETNPPPQNAEGRSRAPPLNVAADPPVNAEASIPVNTSYSACPMNFSFLNDID